MRILILQLSDIHFRESGNTVDARRHAITEAVRNLEPGAGCCVLLLTGDVAFSGLGAEYMAAYEFIETLRQELHIELSNQPPVHVVAIPGNHDCALQSDQAARNLIRDRLTKNPHEAIDDSIVDVCTEVQREFFIFLAAVQEEATLHRSGKLYYE